MVGFWAAFFVTTWLWVLGISTIIHASLSLEAWPKNLQRTDLEKFVNCPKAENSELFNVFKIVCFATIDEHRYIYQMLVWHIEILKS